MFNTFRRLLFWSHLVCGVAAGIVILIMCVTGVALTYQKEMQWWADTRHYRAAPGAGAARASVDRIMGAVRAFDAPLRRITVADCRANAVRFSTERFRAEFSAFIDRVA